MTDFNLAARAQEAYSEVATVECEPNKSAWLAAIEAVGHDALQAAEDICQARRAGLEAHALKVAEKNGWARCGRLKLDVEQVYLGGIEAWEEAVEELHRLREGK